MIAAVGVSLIFGLRYSQLNKTVIENKAELANHLRNRPEESEEASLRIARTIEDDQQLFDDTLMAAAAKRTAGLVSLVALGVAILAVSMLRTGDSDRKRS